jgi:hypothetical protein
MSHVKPAPFDTLRYSGCCRSNQWNTPDSVYYMYQKKGDMEYRAVTKYLGEDRAEVKIRDLTFTVNQRLTLWREGAKFCPIELVLASLAS